MKEEKDEREEKIIEAAREIFSRYGYRRVTMGEIAQAVKMSRPALYLIFPSKEEILEAVIRSTCQSFLDEIRQGIPNFTTPKEQLIFAFDVWSVRPFELMQTFPDARDLLESSQEFAGHITIEAFAEFEKIVADILEPLIGAGSKLNLSAGRLAHILAGAVHGLKSTAGNVAELRQLLDELITIILASLQGPKAQNKRSK